MDNKLLITKDQNEFKDSNLSMEMLTLEKNESLYTDSKIAEFAKLNELISLSVKVKIKEKRTWT